MPIAGRLYYFTYPGETPPVVLIHGAGGTHLYWPAEIRRLPGHCALAIDLPGHGKSFGCGLQTISAYAEAVLGWLGAVGLSQAVFVGHSLGSAIVQELALDHPEFVLGLILVGAGARLRIHPDILQSSASEATFHSTVKIIMEWAFSRQAPERLVELASRRMAETRPSVLHGDFLACDAFDVMDRVGEISQPTLVICGADDRLTPLRYAQFLAREIAAARLEIIPDAGHMVMLEQPQAVANLVKAFLDRII